MPRNTGKMPRKKAKARPGDARAQQVLEDNKKFQQDVAEWQKRLQDDLNNAKKQKQDQDEAERLRLKRLAE